MGFHLVTRRSLFPYTYGIEPAITEVDKGTERGGTEGEEREERGERRRVKGEGGRKRGRKGRRKEGE